MSPSGRSSSAARKRSQQERTKLQALQHPQVLAHRCPSKIEHIVATRGNATNCPVGLHVTNCDQVRLHHNTTLQVVNGSVKVKNLYRKHSVALTAKTALKCAFWNSFRLKCLVQVLKIAFFQEFWQNEGRLTISVCQFSLSRLPPDSHGTDRQAD